MSEIFYTSVDANLQDELNARAAAGRYNRTNSDLNFMLGKIANVGLIPYIGQTRSDDNIVPGGIIGGSEVRGGEFLPSGPNGFLSDRTFKYTENVTNPDATTTTTVEERTNTSRRVPPFITSLDVSIGDHSMGLLNSATVNITIPNPERDLNFIESVYFRPGRYVTIIIQHPESAIITKDDNDGLLSDDILPSSETIENLFPNLGKEELRKYQKMNSYYFEGQVTKFTIDYQTDMTVVCSISLRGKSTVYTDLQLVTNTETKETDQTNAANPNKPTIGPQQSSAQSASPFITANTEPVEQQEQREQEAAATSFYEQLSKEVDDLIFNYRNEQLNQSNATETAPELPLKGFLVDKSNADAKNKNPVTKTVIFGEPFTGKGYQRYISVDWLIDFLNRIIISKMLKNNPNSQIIFTQSNDLCVSNYYFKLISGNPNNIILPGAQTYGSLYWFSELQQDIENNQDYPVFNDVAKGISYPGRILVNMKLIQENIKILGANGKLTVNELLAIISEDIYSATGGAIQLKLVTHPEKSDFLLYYDCNHIQNLTKNTPVQPYSVPMFANHPAGTVVRDFKFNGSLPSDASNLSYVLNQDTTEISESTIAPFLSYMYSANTVERSGPHETVGNLITKQQLAELKKKYKDTHEKYITALNGTAAKVGKNPDSNEERISLQQALEKYIQYPTEKIELTNNIAAPTIPFEASFTIDGIHGFRYGDVLQFDALPDRYRRNTVFSIININHTVGTNGEWTTGVKCIMRPRID